MSRFRSGVREIVKRVARGSLITRRAYAAWCYRRAKGYRRRGMLYDALGSLCRAHRRLRDPVLTESHLQVMAEILRETCYDGWRLGPHCDNALYHSFAAGDEAQRIREHFRAKPLDDRVRLRDYRKCDGEEWREGYLMILKAPDGSTGEKGVIMLSLGVSFAQFAAAFELSEVLQQYAVVLQPAYSPGCDPSLFLYAGTDADVLLASSCAEDHDFIHRVQLNMRSVLLGSSDWVDTDLFSPIPDVEREYDLVMTATWMVFKRHSLLFRSLAALHPRKLRVALIGSPRDLTADGVRREMRHFGVEDQCELFENLPFEQVANIVARSKVALHLTRQEGANKATYEYLCCDTPLIVYRHNLGTPIHCINRSTGVLADDHELPQAIDWMVGHYRDFQPRRWALANTGYERSTRMLNETLKAVAIERRQPWTRDIATRVNRPIPGYKYEHERIALGPAYEALCEYLR
jgi:hypothetical protein